MVCLGATKALRAFSWVLLNKGRSNMFTVDFEAHMWVFYSAT